MSAPYLRRVKYTARGWFGLAKYDLEHILSAWCYARAFGPRENLEGNYEREKESILSGKYSDAAAPDRGGCCRAWRAGGGIGCLGKSQQKMAEAQSTGLEGLLTYLHQEVDVKGSPQRIYEALLDSKQFAAFSGEAAEISREVGGSFSMFAEKIVGRNIELVAGQRIVQAWRPANWDPGLYSLVRFELNAHGAQTRVVLDHTGFPEGSFRHFEWGWHNHYWEPLKKYLAS